MKKIYITLQMLFAVSIAFAQNWSYVGTPYLNGHSSATTYLYFGDLEIDAAGNVLVGYWEYSGKLNFVKYDGSSWTQLATPAMGAASSVDIESHGTDYYISYMGARGSNYYAFVKKYSGSAWTSVGDSILVGGTGQGGSFDFLLDNNGVPTIIGIPKAIFSDKTVKQFISGAWSNTDTIPGTTSSIFAEGSSLFDGSNKLYCYISGQKSITVPPYSIPYALGLEINGSTDVIIGDTIYSQAGPGKMKMDNAGNKYMLFNQPIKSAFLAFKLNGSKWDIISDTANSVGSMVSTDVSGDGKVVFSTLSSTPGKNIYMYNAGARSKMDSININGFAVGGVSDILVKGTDVYVLFSETKSTSATDYCVAKHSLTGGSSSVHRLSANNELLTFYPNPAKTEVRIATTSSLIAVSLIDLSGKLVLEKQMAGDGNAIDVTGLKEGVYFMQVKTENGTITKRLLIQ